MSSTDFFWGLGDLLETVLMPLDADWGITAILNTIIPVGGFIGLFYWLNLQRKFNQQAENNADQLK